MRLAALTIGYVLFGSAAFVVISASSQDLLAFPAVVSLWIAYLCALIPGSVDAFSTPPHPPRRVTAIAMAAGIVALAALALSVYAGVWVLARRAGFNGP
jgi:hypothetical protein